MSALLSKFSHEMINFINYANAIICSFCVFIRLYAIFSIDFAHGTHQASKIIVDWLPRKWKWKTPPKKNNHQQQQTKLCESERACARNNNNNTRQRAKVAKDVSQQSTLMRLTLVSKWVRTFDHVGLSQSNNREQKQTQIKQIHDIRA